MIPIFKPVTARKEINKNPGDGELAKLANLNRLVENVNTIVANGIPSATPTFTYINIGEANMKIEFILGVLDKYTSNPSSGTKVLQVYYLPLISISNNEELTSIIFPDAQFVENIRVFNSNILTTISAPLLHTVTKLLQINGTNDKLLNVNLPLLIYVYEDGITIEKCLSVNLTSLAYVTYINISNCAFTNLNIPLLVNTYNIDIYDNINLTSISIGTIGTLKSIDGNLGLTNNALITSSINNVLALLVSLDGTNGTTLFESDVYLNGGTNAAPTGQGLIDKATLQARGCSVTTN